MASQSEHDQATLPGTRLERLREKRFGTGHIGGIQIWTHVSIPLFTMGFIVFECALDPGGGLMLAYSLIFCGVLWISTILHELAIAMAARRFGTEVTEVHVWPWGGWGNTGIQESALKDVVVTVCGPLSHAPVCIALLGYLAWRDEGLYDLLFSDMKIEDDFGLYTAVGITSQQLSLLALNLEFPVYPFDAARLFMTVMAWLNVSISKGAFAAAVVATSLLVFGLGFTIYVHIHLKKIHHIRFMTITSTVWAVYQLVLMYRGKSEAELRQSPFGEPYKMLERRTAHATGGESGGGLVSNATATEPEAHDYMVREQSI